MTDRRAIHSPNPNSLLIEKVRAAIGAGVDWVQKREKDMAGTELLNLTRAAIAASCDAAAGKKDSPRIIVNDRLDVALAADADGVHFGSESVPIQEAVRWIRKGNAPRNFLVGFSCHGLEEAKRAEDAGVDYLFFGPVFETPSKLSFGSPQGLQRLKKVCEAVTIPVLAIGGVGEDNAHACIRAGAAGIAAIRLFQELQPDLLRETVMRLRSSA